MKDKKKKPSMHQDVRKWGDEKGFRPAITPKVQETLRQMYGASKPTSKK